MKKIDLFIVIGLIVSLGVYMGIGIQGQNVRTDIILDNQQLLTNAVETIDNVADTILVNQEIITNNAGRASNNTQLILDSQESIVSLTNNTSRIIEEHQGMSHGIGDVLNESKQILELLNEHAESEPGFGFRHGQNATHQ